MLIFKGASRRDAGERGPQRGDREAGVRPGESSNTEIRRLVPKIDPPDKCVLGGWVDGQMDGWTNGHC